jgi:DNA-binding NarL/FixJ family response regulator
MDTQGGLNTDLNKITVMVIDDHPLFRNGLINVLASEPDIEVVGESDDGQLGLDQARDLQPDVVVVDINLPSMNGLQVTHHLIADRTGMKVVLLTAYDDQEQVLHAMRAGASAYCSKDITPSKLVDVVRQVAEGHYVLNEHIFDERGIQDWLNAGVEAVTGPYMVDPNEHFVPLSPREMEILQYVTRGMSNKEIAFSLGISHQTVKNHMTSILRKLDVEDRTQAAVYALRHGWVRLQDTHTDSGADP